MQVICTDGTVFTCESYELTEYGVVLYDQPQDPEAERYDSEPAQAGYVPHDRLWYVLPDGVRSNLEGVTPTQPGAGRAAGQAASGGQTGELQGSGQAVGERLPGRRQAGGYPESGQQAQESTAPGYDPSPGGSGSGRSSR